MGNNASVDELSHTSVVSRPRVLKRRKLFAKLKRSRSVRRMASIRCLRRNSRKAMHAALMEQELRMSEEIKELFEAAEIGDAEYVQELLDMGGIDANAADENQTTALHRASMYAREKVIEVLLERGADANATDLKGGFSPLHWVIINAHPQICSTNHVDKSIIALYRGGCDINSTDFNFSTPLHIAAQKGNRVCIDTLIRLGADPEQKDIMGRNCFKVAKNEETRSLIKRLQHMKKTVVYHVLEIPPQLPPRPGKIIHSH